MPSNTGASSSSKKYKEPATDQKGLERFLGIAAPARQQRLAFAAGSPTSSSSPAFAMSSEHFDVSSPQPGPTVVKEEDKVEMDVDKEEEEVEAAGARPKKRRTIAVASSDVEPDGEDQKESNKPGPKRPKTETPSTTTSPAVKSNGKASTFAPIASSSSASSSITHAKAGVSKFKAQDDKPPVSSFFAPRKPTAPKPAAAKANAAEDDDDDAASGAHDEDDENDEEDDDEAESEEDTEAAVKFADIFTRKASVAKSKKGWEAGKEVPYSALAETFELIGATTKRLEITSILTHFLIDVIEKTPSDLLRTVYLCINRLCPDYESLELGIGESLLMKAICQSTGRKMDQIKSEFTKQGDLGMVAQASREKQKTLFKPKPLTVNAVFKLLRDVATVSGKDSQTRKIGFINKLLAACEGVETKYIIRSLEGKLRIGLAERTVITALAQAFVTSETAKEGRKLSPDKMAARLEEGTSIIKDVFSQIPSYDLVIPALLKGGLSTLKDHCHLTPGIPLKPMLAKPTKAISEVLDRFENKQFTCEYKYDGERAQVHYLDDGSVKVFSRNSENMSAKYPDIVAQLPACVNKEAGTTSFVIDCEAVAWDPVEKKLLPFQELSRRRRKDVKAADITVKVHLFAFDLLYLNGRSLLSENLIERRRLLRAHLSPVEEQFAYATSEDASSIEEIQIFLDKSVKDGCEGLMVKMLEGEGATYEPSRRSIHWLKLKKDYLAGVGDSFDLVVVGADFGAGKRTGVYGAFHLACFDDESQAFQAICKIGTGFSDEALKSHHERLVKGKDGDDEEAHGELLNKPHDVDFGGVVPKNLPDVYFNPNKSMVWEVLAADLSLSPVYPAAAGKCDSRGISLRFPRFLRIRDDKAPEDATDSDQVAEAYRRQANTTKPGKFGGGGDDGGFY